MKNDELDSETENATVFIMLTNFVTWSGKSTGKYALQRYLGWRTQSRLGQNVYVPEILCSLALLVKHACFISFASCLRPLIPKVPGPYYLFPTVHLYLWVPPPPKVWLTNYRGTHMCWIHQPQHYNAAAGENWVFVYALMSRRLKLHYWNFRFRKLRNDQFFY